MKKITALILVLTSVCLCALSVFADDEKFGDAWELYSSWEGEFPDYVCGVWLSDDGVSLTFAVLEGAEGDVAKTVILSAVEDESTVKFETSKFTLDELKVVKDELEVYIGKNIGIKSTYLDVKRNRIEVLVLAERVNDRTTQSIVATLKEKYGEKLSITYDGDMFKQTNLAVGAGSSDGDNARLESTRFLIIIACVVIVFLASGYMVVMTKRTQLMEWAAKRGFKTAETSVGTLPETETKKDEDISEHEVDDSESEEGKSEEKDEEK